MTRSQNNPWLHRFALLTAAATLFLIWVGGLVTSHGAGMAVPDWPTTYGYNMFFFPFSRWVDGIFYEHSHRIVASGVGMLTAILAGWIWVRETSGRSRYLGLSAIAAALALMGVRTQWMFVVMALCAAMAIVYCLFRVRNEERPLRWWAMIAFSAVLIQGVLGGLRVTQMKDVIGVFHATLAQAFFALLCSIALVTSHWWQRNLVAKLGIYGTGAFRYVFALVSGMILAQLILGASMRHQHAGLAISDFPLAHGKVWPATDSDSVARYNRERGEIAALNPITASQINLQMAHRLTALAILLAVAWLAGAVRRRFPGTVLSKGAAGWLGLILAQAALGATTIWSNKAADVATAHVALGALSLVTGVALWLIAVRSVSAAKAVTVTKVWDDAKLQPESDRVPA